MATKNRIPVMIGLCVLSSFGWATLPGRAHADEPRDTNSSTAAATTPSERYLMLINGQLIKGVVTEDQKNFLVRQRIGVMPFAKERVAGVFDSVREAYEYQVKQLPDRDCEERMKLAQWCLSAKLPSEAQEQLLKVLELNSKHSQARAMLFTMEQAASLAAQRRRDPEVKQTGAESVLDNHPGALDSAVIQKAQRGLNIMGIPVIFDLPTPLAIKRTQEFIKFVNPLLQAYCVKCHDANYTGEFQLVPTRNRSEQTQDALRVNLDATLRLIDQENLAKSELLTTSLRPHGDRARKRPIFPGSNDKAYQILAAWVQSLKSPKDLRASARNQTGRVEPDSGEVFAVGRERRDNDNPESNLPLLPESRRSALANTPSSSGIPRPTPFSPGGTAPDGSRQEPPDDFPLPFLITGKKPNLAPQSPKAGEREIDDRSSESRPRRATSPSANAGADLPQDTLTTGSGKPGEPGKTSTRPGTTKKKSKPVEIDPGLLERALQLRNGLP